MANNWSLFLLLALARMGCLSIFGNGSGNAQKVEFRPSAKQLLILIFNDTQGNYYA